MFKANYSAHRRPGPAERRRHQAGSGYGNRHLWTCAKRSKLLPEGAGDIAGQPRLASRLHGAVEFAQDVGEIRRDESAKDVWHRPPWRAGDILGSYLLLAAGLTFVVFTNLFGSQISEDRDASDQLGGLLRIVGTLSGGAMVLAAVAALTVPLSIALGEITDDPGLSEGRAALPSFAYVPTRRCRAIRAGASVLERRQLCGPDGPLRRGRGAPQPGDRDRFTLGATIRRPFRCRRELGQKSPDGG